VQCDLNLFSYDLIDDLARSFRRGAPGVSDRRRQAAVSIFWTASPRRGSVTSAWTAVYALVKPPAVFVHDRVLVACSARAPSPGTLAFDAAMRGESDRVRRGDGWDSRAVPAAAGGVLSPFTNDRFDRRHRRVVAVVFGSSWQSSASPIVSSSSRSACRIWHRMVLSTFPRDPVSHRPPTHAILSLHGGCLCRKIFSPR
jgi:hypothetical protein